MSRQSFHIPHDAASPRPNLTKANSMAPSTRPFHKERKGILKPLGNMRRAVTGLINPSVPATLDEFDPSSPVGGSTSSNGANKSPQAKVAEVLNNNNGEALHFQAEIIDVPLAEAIVRTLAGVNTQITCLAFENCVIDAPAAEVLAKGIRVNTHLTTLDLSNNSLGNAQVQCIAQALTSNLNSNISEIFMSHNEIGDSGFLSIVTCIQEKDKFRFPRNKIQHLDFSHNFLGDESAKALSEILPQNSSLRVVDLSANVIGDAGVAELSAAFKKNTTIDAIFLAQNRASSNKMTALQRNARKEEVYDTVEQDMIFNSSSSSSSLLSSASSPSRSPRFSPFSTTANSNSSSGSSGGATGSTGGDEEPLLQLRLDRLRAENAELLATNQDLLSKLEESTQAYNELSYKLRCYNSVAEKASSVAKKTEEAHQDKIRQLESRIAELEKEAQVQQQRFIAKLQEQESESKKKIAELEAKVAKFEAQQRLLQVAISAPTSHHVAAMLDKLKMPQQSATTTTTATPVTPITGKIDIPIASQASPTSETSGESSPLFPRPRKTLPATPRKELPHTPSTRMVAAPAAAPAAAASNDTNNK